MTSMLLRIWIWAFSDMGRTAPISLPDSTSSSDGIPLGPRFSNSCR